MDPTQIPIRATTQDHLDIEDIQDDLVLLKDGSVCLILQTSAVNFGLLSEQEQDATIFAYAGLLNSLTFPIQIVIKSQQKDVTSYLKLLKNEEDKQKNPILKERIQKYRIFIQNTVRENNVLDKKFYIVIPFSTLELGIQSARGLFKKGLPFPKNYIFERAKTALFPKRDHIVRQFNRLGLKTNQLNTKQLIELFFKAYNPESIGSQQLTSPEEYKEFIVQPGMEIPESPKAPSSKVGSTPNPPNSSNLPTLSNVISPEIQKINSPPIPKPITPPPLSNLPNKLNQKLGNWANFPNTTTSSETPVTSTPQSPPSSPPLPNANISDINKKNT